MTQEIHFGPVIQKLRKGVCRKTSAGGSVVVDIEETEHLMRSTADILAVVVQLHSAPPVSERERELEGALWEIGIYGCGMLNQPVELNGTKVLWLERRIVEYERTARNALAASPPASGDDQ